MLSVPDEDLFILLGDFNARVGTAGGGGGLEDDWSLVRGPHGFGQINEAGEELLSFLHLLDAVVCNSWFHFILVQFIEKCHEHRTRAFLVYINPRKAYNSIPRAALWSVLSRMGVPEHLVRLIESFHSGMSARVLVDGIGLEDIAVNNGLRQGCCMAPALFNIYACAVFERWSSRIEDYGDVGLTLRFKLDNKLFRRASVCGAPSLSVMVSSLMMLFCFLQPVSVLSACCSVLRMLLLTLGRVSVPQRPNCR